MLTRLGFDADDLGLALILWVCALPLIALIVMPIFGFQGASLAAIALLLIFLVICWGTFRQRVQRNRGQ
jgi:hypothetical protein